MQFALQRPAICRRAQRLTGGCSKGLELNAHITKCKTLLLIPTYSVTTLGMYQSHRIHVHAQRSALVVSKYLLSAKQATEVTSHRASILLMVISNGAVHRLISHSSFVKRLSSISSSIVHTLLINVHGPGASWAQPVLPSTAIPKKDDILNMHQSFSDQDLFMSL